MSENAKSVLWWLAITAAAAWLLLPAKHIESKPEEVVGEFRTKNYDVSDQEHVVVFDIPNRVFPTRCWTYVNEKTGISNMQCDPTDDSSAPPIMGQTLDR